MALQLNIENSNVGVGFNAAYARIDNFHGSSDYVMYTVLVFANADARANNMEPVARFHYDCSYPSGPLLENLYVHLKQQPEFAGSEDC